jgi:protein phosphatase
VTPITLADPSSDLTAVAAGVSELGNYREHNEDHLLIEPDPPLCLVLDGMGGAGVGSLAGQAGAEAIRAAIGRGLRAGTEPPALIEQALRQGHQSVQELSRLDAELRSCATTVVLALISHGRVWVSWVGDAMAYRVSGGKVERLTWPHDFRHYAVRNRIISEAEAGDHFIKNVLVNYLGGELPETLEIPSFVPSPGDRLILTTDGITGVLEDSALLDACRECPEPQACVEHLVRLALDRNSRDNCTCAVIAFPGDVEAAPAPPRKWWRLWR